MKVSRFLQKTVALTGVVIATSLPLTSYADVQASSGSGTTNYLLTLILGTTYKILTLMNQSPAYMEEVTEMAKSWNTTDDPNNTIGNNQYAFAQLGQLRTSGDESQLSATLSLTEQFLKAGSFNPSRPVLPNNANDLTYTILFGRPLIKPTTTSPFQQQTAEDYSQNIQNYMKNVTGSMLILDQPNPNWPTSKSKTQYTNLYNMLAAIQSYDQYLISGLTNLKSSTDLNATLTTQATNPDWFKQISTEALGLVFRHILLYVSQSFVQINQVIELQQKQLAVQAMTNSLLTILVQSNIGPSLQRGAASSGQPAAPSPTEQI